MTPVQRDKHDLKVLLVVAGGVLAAVAGIAMLAGLSARYNEQKDRMAHSETAPVRQEHRAEPAPMLARHTPATEIVTPIAAPNPPQAPAAEPVAPAPIVDPDADFVKAGLAAYGKREFEIAAAYFAAEVEARPGRAWPHYMLGLSEWKAGRLDEAESALVESAVLNDGSTRTWINLARVRNDAGRFEEALDAAQRAVDIEEDSSTALYLVARSLRNASRSGEAVAALEQSLALDPDNGHAHNLLGLIRIEQGRASEAEAALQLAATLLPDVPYVHNNLGMALELDGRPDEAALAYARAIEIDPGQVRASSNLARLGPLPARSVPTVEEPAVEMASTEPARADDATDLGIHP